MILGVVRRALSLLQDGMLTLVLAVLYTMHLDKLHAVWHAVMTQSIEFPGARRDSLA